MFPRLPGRSAVKVLAETTCGCRQTRPARAQRRRRARGRTRPYKFPSSPARHFAPGRGASQEARRPLAGSLFAGSPLLPPSSRLLPLHGCRTEPLNSHHSPPPPARRAGGAPAPACAPGCADRRPPSNSPGDRSPAPAMRSHPPGAPRPPTRLSSRDAVETATLAVDAPARHAKPLTSARRRTRAPPALGAGRCPRVRLRRRPSLCAGAARAARLSESRGWAAPAVWSRAAVAGARQLLPPRSAPPPSSCPASRAAAVSPAPRAWRPRCQRQRLGVRTGLKGPDV